MHPTAVEGARAAPAAGSRDSRRCGACLLMRPSVTCLALGWKLGSSRNICCIPPQRGMKRLTGALSGCEQVQLQ